MRVLPVVVVIALVAASAVQAARAPRPAERTAILRVTHAYVSNSGCCATFARIKVVAMRVSTADSRWALVRLAGFDKRGRSAGTLSASLHKDNVTRKWSVRSFGTINLGCQMPPAVQDDLQQICFG